MTIVGAKANPANVMAALSMAMGTVLAATVASMSSTETKEKLAIEAAVAHDGPLVKTVRMSMEKEIKGMKEKMTAVAPPVFKQTQDQEPRWGQL